MQLFAHLLGISANKIVKEVIQDEYLEDMFLVEQNDIQPIHYLVAEEILRQLLGNIIGNVENWRHALADVAIQFAEMCRRYAQLPRGRISEILQNVFLGRHSTESEAGQTTAAFSALVLDIPNTEGRARVLSRLTELFPYEPHYWAHYGRFHSRVTGNHMKAHECHNWALQLDEDDPSLHHMAGMSIRIELQEQRLNRRDWSVDDETEILKMVEEASVRFADARQLDPRGEHSYISTIQMIDRVIGTAAIRKGYQNRTAEFLVSREGAEYRRLLDEAEALLDELEVSRGGDSASLYQISARNSISKLYGDYSNAIQGWFNLLSHRDVYRPPVRRNIIHAYVARQQGQWSKLNPREANRVLALAEQNLTEEQHSDRKCTALVQGSTSQRWNNYRSCCRSFGG